MTEETQKRRGKKKLQVLRRLEVMTVENQGQGDVEDEISKRQSHQVETGMIMEFIKELYVKSRNETLGEGCQLRERKPTIGFFWDIENCAVPRGKSTLLVVKRIRDKFTDGCKEVEFMCVCDVRRMLPSVVEELNDAQVTVVHVNGNSKNAADEKLRQAMRRFADKYANNVTCARYEQQSAVMVLISNDVDFAADLTDLRYRYGVYVILLHGRQPSLALMMPANDHHLFENLLFDIPNKGKVTPVFFQAFRLKEPGMQMLSGHCPSVSLEQDFERRLVIKHDMNQRCKEYGRKKPFDRRLRSANLHRTRFSFRSLDSSTLTHSHKVDDNERIKNRQDTPHNSNPCMHQKFPHPVTIMLREPLEKSTYVCNKDLNCDSENGVQISRNDPAIRNKLSGKKCYGHLVSDSDVSSSVSPPLPEPTSNEDNTQYHLESPAFADEIKPPEVRTRRKISEIFDEKFKNMRWKIHSPIFLTDANSPSQM